METQKKVLDASITVKWFSKEIDSEKAIKLKDEHISGKSIIIIPTLTFFETMNSLRYKEKEESKLKEANEMLHELQLKVENITKFLIDKTIENSYKYGITIYDSLYVSLSQLHGCSLITTDKDLYKIPNVLPLEKT